MHVIRGGERGFTVIEVVIAVLLLAALASSVALAVAGGERMRGSARLQASMTSAALRVQDEVVGDRSWMDGAGCSTAGAQCSVAGVVRASSLRLDDVDGTASLSYARSMAIDSEIDGTASSDEDGVVPDYYRIEIELRPSADVARRYATTPDQSRRRVVTTIDRRGVEQVGSLAVEICRVTNQSDERIAIQGCAGSGMSSIEIAGCPPSARPGCEPAFGWIAGRAASETAPSPFVAMRRISPSSMGFTVVNASTGRSWSSGSADIVGGIAVFKNLPAGDYQINGLPASAGGGSERWKSKEIPAFHGSSSDAASGPSVVVEPGLRNQALVLFRPTRTDASIGLYFDRETYTRHVRGAFTSARETAVPEWTPTTSYMSDNAEQMCDYSNEINQILSDDIASELGSSTCDGVEVAGNCARTYSTGFYYKDVPAGQGTVLIDKVGSIRILITEAPPEMYNAVRVSWSHALTGVFCTFYAEYLWHTYYARTGATTMTVRPGAVSAATYWMEPKPDNRVVDLSAGGATIPVSLCTAAVRGQCSNRLGPLHPGLNSSVMILPPDASNAAENENIIAMPSWARGAGLWVQPSGAIISSDGASRGTAPLLSMRGRGECYWRSVRFAVEAEGSCDPCSPRWTPTLTVPGACSILTQTRWERPAIERIESFTPSTGASTGTYGEVLPTRSGTITFNPPWRCSTAIPHVAPSSTCRRFPTGGGGTPGIPRTVHPSPKSGGSGVVQSVSFSEGAG